MRRTLALAVLLCLTPRIAPAQTPITPVNLAVSDNDLDRDIRFWEDMRHRIEELKQLYIPGLGQSGAGEGLIISREQEADLFGTLILTGQVSPDSVLAMHQRFKLSTQVYLQTVKQSLKVLNDEAGRRSQVPRGLLPNDLRGAVSGRWAVACWRDGIALSEGGTFSLRLLGDGTVSGTYIGPSGSFGVGGRIDDAGNIDGGGNHPDGTFSYLARVRTNGQSVFLLGGSVQFVPRDPEITCAGGELSPAALN